MKRSEASCDRSAEHSNSWADDDAIEGGASDETGGATLEDVVARRERQAASSFFMSVADILVVFLWVSVMWARRGMLCRLSC